MLPYGLVIPLVLLWLVFQHVRSPNVSARSKCWVVGLAAATVVVPWLGIRVSYAPIIFQCGLALFLVVQRMVGVAEGSHQNALSVPTDEPCGPGKSPD
jgi:apolipoprotein N-acyltransferase